MTLMGQALISLHLKGSCSTGASVPSRLGPVDKGGEYVRSMVE